MPKRLISSDVFSHPVLAKLPLSATLVWIGLIVEADGDGRVCVDPLWIRRRLLRSLNRPSNADVLRFIDVCAADGMLSVYDRGGLKYARITNFHRYQHLRYRHTSRTKRREDEEKKKEF